MASIVEPTRFPYQPGHQWTAGEIWGGSGGPSSSGVPDGTPAEVKNRLAQVLTTGAENLLAFLQYKAFGPSRVESDERDGALVPYIDQATGQVRYRRSEEPAFSIFGRARTVTRFGIIVVAILGGLLLINLMRDSRR